MSLKSTLYKACLVIDTYVRPTKISRVFTINCCHSAKIICAKSPLFTQLKKPKSSIIFILSKKNPTITKIKE